MADNHCSNGREIAMLKNDYLRLAKLTFNVSGLLFGCYGLIKLGYAILALVG